MKSTKPLSDGQPGHTDPVTVYTGPATGPDMDWKAAGSYTRARISPSAQPKAGLGTPGNRPAPKMGAVMGGRVIPQASISASPKAITPDGGRTGKPMAPEHFQPGSKAKR